MHRDDCSAAFAAGLQRASALVHTNARTQEYSADGTEGGRVRATLHKDETSDSRGYGTSW